MPKSIVGKFENKSFAFFWMLIGGGLGNLVLMPYSIQLWPVLLPSAILSMVIAITMVDGKKRPKLWLGADLILTVALLVFFVEYIGTSGVNLTIFLPQALIILGCVFGIMDW